MPVIRQRTVNGNTYRLRKEETQKSGTQFEYYLTKNQKIATDPVYTKRDAMSQFKGVTNRAKEGDDKLDKQKPRFPWEVGSNSPSLPGFDNDDDRDKPPWMP